MSEIVDDLRTFGEAGFPIAITAANEINELRQQLAEAEESAKDWQVEAENYQAKYRAQLEAAEKVSQEPCGTIDFDEEMNRYYIPVHAKWEIQTKGKGSSFRIANAETGYRWLVGDSTLHEMLEQMARDIHASATATPPSTALSVELAIRKCAEVCDITTLDNNTVISRNLDWWEIKGRIESLIPSPPSLEQHMREFGMKIGERVRDVPQWECPDIESIVDSVLEEMK